MSPVLTSTEVKRRLVEYSSSDSDLANSNIPTGLSKSDATIIYSSESDTSITEVLVPRQKLIPQYIRDIYSSSDDENMDPISRQEHTPKKQRICNDIYNIRQVCDSSSTSSGSEDILPLSRLKAKKVLKSPFQQLLPTPNFVVVKQKKPRLKSINYKGRIVTKDLFAERVITKENNTKQQHKKKTEDEQPHAKRNKKELQSKKKNEKCIKNSRPVNRNEEKRQNKEHELGNKTIKKKINDFSQIDTTDKWYCHACNTEKLEDMRQCPGCQRWFHEECVGLTKEDIDFECPMCN
ncbi:unnamed protein product [Parnassius mnemosyne]|uniref:PHD-type domain-containing protein n=1 Tax=Parnassius mnemosyne TaxID=213953 RepID=A0AAV1K6D6_9NEOP